MKFLVASFLFWFVRRPGVILGGYYLHNIYFTHYVVTGENIIVSPRGDKTILNNNISLSSLFLFGFGIVCLHAPYVMIEIN